MSDKSVTHDSRDQETDNSGSSQYERSWPQKVLLPFEGIVDDSFENMGESEGFLRAIPVHRKEQPELFDWGGIGGSSFSNPASQKHASILRRHSGSAGSLHIATQLQRSYGNQYVRSVVARLRNDHGISSRNIQLSGPEPLMIVGPEPEETREPMMPEIPAQSSLPTELPARRMQELIRLAESLRRTFADTPEYRQLHRNLGPLRTTMTEPGEENRRELEFLFRARRGYPLGQFIDDFAGCVERMADEGRFRGLHASDTTERWYAQRYFRQITEGIAHAYPAIGGVAERRALAIYDRRPARSEERERQREENEPRWISFWQQHFAGSSPGVPRLGRWILENWEDFVDGAGVRGAAAHRLVPGEHRWVARRNETWNRSMWVLSSDPQTRERGIVQGNSYFGAIYSTYGRAFGRLCATAAAAEWANRPVVGQRRPWEDIFTELVANIPAWQLLRSSLTASNQSRMTAIWNCWEQYWLRGRYAGDSPVLRRAGIYIQMSGGIAWDNVDLEA
ncbi:MAG: hypothetical protein IBX68_05480 [Dehalococcoidia bacterium]|nr:hypothetical protein [Dehalococcoidia bacterium]